MLMDSTSTLLTHHSLLIPFLQPAIEPPLLKKLHIITAQHLTRPLGLDPQSPHPKHIPFDIPRQPPSPQIAKPARDHGGRADPEGHLVSIVRPFGLEELRSDDAADLANAGLEGEGESCSGGASEGGGAPYCLSV
jgi:hypothetical protein